MELLVLAGLILLNGLFAMSELALVSASSHRLEKLSKEGDRSASRALLLKAKPTQFLSTIQIGITAIGVLNGIVGEAAIAGPLANQLIELGVPAGTSAWFATFFVVAIVTYFTIVVGELVPKRLAQMNAEGISRFVSSPISFLAKVAHPFVLLLSWSTDTLLRAVGGRESAQSGLTEEDIHAILAKGSTAGVIEQHEHELVRNVFRLDDRQLGSLMTPRSEIDYLEVGQPWEETLDRLLQSDHSRFPVSEGSLEKVLGVTTAKQLLKANVKGKVIDLRDGLEPAVFVPESLTGMMLLQQFRASDVQMVFVVDEYGELHGLVTIQDVFEALAGEFKPHRPEDVRATQREDGSWLLDGLIPILELKDYLDLRSVPGADRVRYHTLSGMLMWLFDRLPTTGDHTEWEGWRFEVVDLDGNRVDKVLATPISEEDAPTDEAG